MQYICCHPLCIFLTSTSAVCFSSCQHFKYNRGKKGVHNGQRGEVYDLLCRRKNKQKRNDEEEEQRRLWNNENRKELFPCFLQLFSHGKAPVILLSLLQYTERAWWDLKLTTCVCLVTLVNDPNYLPPCCEQSINN